MSSLKNVLLISTSLLSLTAQAAPQREFLVKGGNVGQNSMPDYMMLDGPFALGSNLLIDQWGTADANGLACLTGKRVVRPQNKARYILETHFDGYSSTVVLIAQVALVTETLENPTYTKETLRFSKQIYDRNCKSNYVSAISKGGQLTMYRVFQNTKLENKRVILSSAEEAERVITPFLEEVAKRNAHQTGSGAGIQDPRSAGEVFHIPFRAEFSARGLVDYAEGLLKSPASELIQLMPLSVRSTPNPVRVQSTVDRIRSKWGF